MSTHDRSNSLWRQDGEPPRIHRRDDGYLEADFTPQGRIKRSRSVEALSRYRPDGSLSESGIRVRDRMTWEPRGYADEPEGCLATLWEFITCVIGGLFFVFAAIVCTEIMDSLWGIVVGVVIVILLGWNHR